MTLLLPDKLFLWRAPSVFIIQIFNPRATETSRMILSRNDAKVDIYQFTTKNNCNKPIFGGI